MRKPFAIPDTIRESLSETISLAERNITSLKHQYISIDLIDLDPTNPRELAIERSDLPQGPRRNDPLYTQKKQELEETIKPLAETIKKVGVRSPIEVYQTDSKYKLISGECRVLSTILAGLTEIPALISDKKPNDYEIKLLQLIENEFRTSLTLQERLKNIETIYKQYQLLIESDTKLDTAFIQNVLCCSERQARNFSVVLNGTDEVKQAIYGNKLHNLEKAALITGIVDKQLRARILKTTIDKGMSLKAIKDLIKTIKTQKNKTNKCGKKLTRINLGFTRNVSVIKKICTLILQEPYYQSFSAEFSSINWNNYEDCAKGFNSILKMMEKMEINKKGEIDSNES